MYFAKIHMIHYHGSPITPASCAVKVLKGKHAMISYHNPEQVEIAAEVCQSIVLDNGAFSAWSSGVEFDAPGYLIWAKNWLRHPSVDWCLIPDKINGTEAENAKFVRDWPLAKALSVPVWHLHESLEYLRWLCNSFNRIALGSSGQYRDPGALHWWGRIHEAMQVICDLDGMPKIKIHGLRMLDPVIFSHVPLSSADSTNVARNIGIDSRWTGAYSPASKELRALIIMDRIESHASATAWNNESKGVQQNFSLLG